MFYSKEKIVFDNKHRIQKLGIFVKNVFQLGFKATYTEEQ